MGPSTSLLLLIIFVNISNIIVDVAAIDCILSVIVVVAVVCCLLLLSLLLLLLLLRLLQSSSLTGSAPTKSVGFHRPKQICNFSMKQTDCLRVLILQPKRMLSYRVSGLLHKRWNRQTRTHARIWERCLDDKTARVCLLEWESTREYLRFYTYPDLAGKTNVSWGIFLSISLLFMTNILLLTW